VLTLLSASSRAMADPAALLGQALDAPEPGVVAAALEYLQEVRRGQEGLGDYAMPQVLSCLGFVVRALPGGPRA
jgi:hypothetical protein